MTRHTSACRQQPGGRAAGTLPPIGCVSSEGRRGAAERWAAGGRGPERRPPAGRRAGRGLEASGPNPKTL